MAEPKLTLDEGHIYRLGERRLASVTTILSRLFPFDRDRIASRVAELRGVSVAEVLAEWDAKRRRGTRHHEAIRRLLLEDGPARDVHPTALAVLAQLEPVAVELPVASPKYGVAGTVDLVGRTRSGRLVILDWKTGKVSRYNDGKLPSPLARLGRSTWNKYGLQLALYDRLLAEWRGLEAEAWYVVALDGDGVLPAPDYRAYAERLLAAPELWEGEGRE